MKAVTILMLYCTCIHCAVHVYIVLCMHTLYCACVNWYSTCVMFAQCTMLQKEEKNRTRKVTMSNATKRGENRTRTDHEQLRQIMHIIPPNVRKCFNKWEWGLWGEGQWCMKDYDCYKWCNYDVTVTSCVNLWHLIRCDASMPCLSEQNLTNY